MTRTRIRSEPWICQVLSRPGTSTIRAGASWRSARSSPLWPGWASGAFGVFMSRFDSYDNVGLPRDRDRHAHLALAQLPRAARRSRNSTPKPNGPGNYATASPPRQHSEHRRRDNRIGDRTRKLRRDTDPLRDVSLQGGSLPSESTGTFARVARSEGFLDYRSRAVNACASQLRIWPPYMGDTARWPQDGASLAAGREPQGLAASRRESTCRHGARRRSRVARCCGRCLRVEAHDASCAGARLSVGEHDRSGDSTRRHTAASSRSADFRSRHREDGALRAAASARDG